MSDPKKKDNRRLTEHKTPFVMRDLDMAFNSATRERNTLEKLRQWQIFLSISLTTLFVSSIGINHYYSFGTLVINIIICYIEIGIRWSMFLIGEKSGRQERLLEKKDIKLFEKNIINWEFGTGLSKPYYRKNFCEIFKKIVWNSPFIL